MTYKQAIAFAAELNGLGILVYLFHTQIAAWVGWEEQSTLISLILFVLTVWIFRVVRTTSRSES